MHLSIHSLTTILLVLPVLLMATAQEPDILMISGQRYELNANPLRNYFSEENPSPDWLTREGVESTANWRGYVATWEIKNNKLYLIDIEKEYERPGEQDFLRGEKRQIPLSRIIPDANYPLFASWFSGELPLPIGEVLQDLHMGYETFSEKTILYAIENGEVISRNLIDHRGKNLYRSMQDIQWCELQNGTMDASGEWTDARLLADAETQALFPVGELVTTRGIYFTPPDADDSLASRWTPTTPSLWIPATPKTGSYQIYLKNKIESTGISDGTPVQVEGHFIPAGKSLKFVAIKIEPLNPGQTIHDPAYPKLVEAINALKQSYAEKALKEIRSSAKKPSEPQSTLP